MVYRGKREEYKQFARRLQDALRDKGWSQTDLATEVGLSKGMISLYMSSKSMPESDRLAVIARALEVSPVWLMGANVNKNGSANISKGEDARWIQSQLETATPENLALIRRLFEAVQNKEA